MDIKQGMILPPDVYCHYLSFGKKNQRQKRAYMTTMIRVNFQTANNLHDQVEFPVFTQWLYWDVPNISYKFLLESTIQWFLVYSVWATQHHNWFRVFSGTKSHLPSSLTPQSLALTPTDFRVPSISSTYWKVKEFLFHPITGLILILLGCC